MTSRRVLIVYAGLFRPPRFSTPRRNRIYDGLFWARANAYLRMKERRSAKGEEQP